MWHRAPEDEDIANICDSLFPEAKIAYYILQTNVLDTETDSWAVIAGTWIPLSARSQEEP